jgi:hypothetical protein
LAIYARVEVPVLLADVAVFQVTTIVVFPKLKKPIPELDVAGVVSETLRPETNSLTYAVSLLSRASGSTSDGCRACSNCGSRRRSRILLGLFPRLGLI